MTFRMLSRFFVICHLLICHCNAVPYDVCVQKLSGGMYPAEWPRVVGGTSVLDRFTCVAYKR